MQSSPSSKRTAMENHHFEWENHHKSQFSIAMLNYQRVHQITMFHHRISSEFHQRVSRMAGHADNGVYCSKVGLTVGRRSHILDLYLNVNMCVYVYLHIYIYNIHACRYIDIYTLFYYIHIYIYIYIS